MREGVIDVLLPEMGPQRVAVLTFVHNNVVNTGKLPDIIQTFLARIDREQEHASKFSGWIDRRG